MAVELNINGLTYSFPEPFDEDWGQNVTDWATAVSGGALLQKNGGSFTLLDEVDFGATYGLISTYYKSKSSNIATDGELRLATNDEIVWRNVANDGNLVLTVNGSDQLTFGGSSILNVINSVSDTSTIDLTITAGALSADVVTASITNSLINASAAIAWSKMANLTTGRVLVSDGSGDVSPSSVTTTTLGYLDATSSVQTQLDAMVEKAGDTMTGALTLSGAPTLDLHAATKKYVDDNSGGGGGTFTRTQPIRMSNTQINTQVLASQTGNGLPVVVIAGSSITTLSSTRVAVFTTTDDDLRTYDFDGTDWAQVGNDLNIPITGVPSITALYSTRIAFIDSASNNLRTYDFDGTDWAQVGNNLNITGALVQSITALSSTRIAFIDSNNDDLRTYDFDGTDWAQVGNDLNISGALTPSITSLSSTRIAFIDSGNDDLRTYDFDGTNWAQVGNDLNISGVGNQSITALSSTRIAFISSTINELRTYDFNGLVPATTVLDDSSIAYIDTNVWELSKFQYNGIDWEQVGNSLKIVQAALTPGTTDIISISALSSTRIAFIDSTNRDLRTYDFDGTDWAQVGNDLNISGAIFPSITALSSTRIAYIDGNNVDLRTYDFDGTDWAQVGNDLNIIGVQVASITALSSTRIAFIDSGNDDLRTYDFDGTDWAQVGNDLVVSVTLPYIAGVSGTEIVLVDLVATTIRFYTFDGTDWTLSKEFPITFGRYWIVDAINSNDLLLTGVTGAAAVGNATTFGELYRSGAYTGDGPYRP